MNTERTRRWQGITLTTLFVGYAGYYICRSNLSVAGPLLLKEYAEQGLNKATLGLIGSIGILCYAVGKVVNCVLVDFFGGRVLFLLGMAVSVLCTVVFGLAGGLLVFAVVWAVNRYVQSGGWEALVKIAGQWFPVRIHATIMAFLSLSFLVGDACARLYLGKFLEWGVGWRGLFFISAATLAFIALVSLFTLRESPRQIGGEEPAANPGNVFGAAGDAARADDLRTLLGPLLVNPMFWLVCVMSAGLTLIRETFNFWMPTYLVEVGGLTAANAAQASMFFPLVGALAVLGAGHLSDQQKGQRGRVVVPSLVLLVVALGLLGVVGADQQPLLTVVLMAGVSCFLLAPYTFCAGVIALDLGGKRGSATAAGLIDSAGYLGAIFSGYGIGQIAETKGWPAAFTFLAGVAFLTLVAATVYWLRQEHSLPEQAAMLSRDGPASSQEAVDWIVGLFRARGAAAYIGEPVSQTEHALQTAWAAEKAGAGSALITAALLHDLGHLLHDLPKDCADKGINDAHERRAARWLATYFGSDVTEPIGLHVAAKQFLCSTEPGYMDRLSKASQVSLDLQGGPLTPEQVVHFRSNPHAAAAVALRRWDEEAKVAGLATPPLEHFRPHLEAALANANARYSAGNL